MTITTTYDLSLHPLDVGFDLRLHPEMRAAMPIQSHLRVRYQDRDRHDAIAEGPPNAVGWRLRDAGYRIRWEWDRDDLDTWSARVVTLRDGTPGLEMINPNEGLGGGPKTRYQYRVESHVLQTRRLPPRGSRWRGEPATPWWEPVRVEVLQAPHILLDWWRACAPPLDPWEQAHLTHHIVAWTPNGREVRYGPHGVGVELQPPLDNWWYACADLAAARAWWYTQRARTI